MFITIFAYMGLYSFSLFLPTTINDLDYSYDPDVSQLMTFPTLLCGLLLLHRHWVAGGSVVVEGNFGRV